MTEPESRRTLLGMPRVRSTESEVVADPAFLHLALRNLIANAIAYSPRGSKVGVGITLTDAVVEIAVTDRGITVRLADPV